MRYQHSCLLSLPPGSRRSFTFGWTVVHWDLSYIVFSGYSATVAPTMKRHTWDEPKVSVHCMWPVKWQAVSFEGRCPVFRVGSLFHQMKAQLREVLGDQPILGMSKRVSVSFGKFLQSRIPTNSYSDGRPFVHASGRRYPSFDATFDLFRIGERV